MLVYAGLLALTIAFWLQRSLYREARATTELHCQLKNWPADCHTDHLSWQHKVTATQSANIG